MPQKRNPDIAELLRAKAGARDRRRGGAADDQQGAAARLQQGPAGDRRSRSTTRSRPRALALGVMPGLIAGLEFDVARMRAAADDPALGATDLAEELVRGGMPFRSAHEVVGRLVRHAEEKKVSLRDLSADDLRGRRRRAVAENLAGAGSGARRRGAFADRRPGAGRGRARAGAARGRAARRSASSRSEAPGARARALRVPASWLASAAEEVNDNGNAHQEKSARGSALDRVTSGIRSA